MAYRLIEFLKLAHSIEHYTNDYSPRPFLGSDVPSLQNIDSQERAAAIRNIVLRSTWIKRYEWHDRNYSREFPFNLKTLTANYLATLCVAGDDTFLPQPANMVFTSIREILKSPNPWPLLCESQRLEPHHAIHFECDPILRWEATYQLGLALLNRDNKEEKSLHEVIVKKVKDQFLSKYSGKSPDYIGNLQDFTIISDDEWQKAIGSAWAIICRCSIVTRNTDTVDWNSISTLLKHWRNQGRNDPSDSLINVIDEIVVDVWRQYSECTKKELIIEDCKRLWADSPVGALYLVCNILTGLIARVYFANQKAFIPFPDLAMRRAVAGVEMSFYEDKWPDGITYNEFKVDYNLREILDYFLGRDCFYLTDKRISFQSKKYKDISYKHLQDYEWDADSCYLRGVLSVVAADALRKPVGTAFVVWCNDRFYIVTCTHVLYSLSDNNPIPKDEVFSFRTTCSVPVKGKLVYADPYEHKNEELRTAREETAILEMDMNNYDDVEPLTISTDGLLNLREGFCYGYALGIGDWVRSISVGSKVGDGYHTVIVSDVKPGFSGSPIADIDGAIKGIVRAKINNTVYAIPIKLALEKIQYHIRRETKNGTIY